MHTWMIRVDNQGPLLAGSNYWQTEAAAAGYFYVSLNSGCIRLLVPDSRKEMMADMRTAKTVVIRFGPHAGFGGREMTEILFDDGSDEPFALHLWINQWERLPLPGDFGMGFEFAAYDDRRGRPHKFMARGCWLGRSAALPDLRPWGKS